MYTIWGPSMADNAFYSLTIAQRHLSSPRKGMIATVCTMVRGDLLGPGVWNFARLVCIVANACRHEYFIVHWLIYLAVSHIALIKTDPLAMRVNKRPTIGLVLFEAVHEWCICSWYAIVFIVRRLTPTCVPTRRLLRRAPERLQLTPVFNVERSQLTEKAHPYHLEQWLTLVSRVCSGGLQGALWASCRLTWLIESREDFLRTSVGLSSISSRRLACGSCELAAEVIKNLLRVSTFTLCEQARVLCCQQQSQSTEFGNKAYLLASQFLPHSPSSISNKNLLQSNLKY